MAVGVVLASKNSDSDKKAAVAVESSMDTPASDTVKEQTQEKAETNVQTPEKPVSETAKAEDAGTATKPVKNIKKQPKSETATKPVVGKKEEPKPVVTTEQSVAVPKSLPKMIELGAEKCVPCKMMKPIIEELQKDYKNRLEVVFIDVWEDNASAEKYGIQSIPTQIFFDENGKEFFRHMGFFPKEDILKTFEEHGIKLN